MTKQQLKENALRQKSPGNDTYSNIRNGAIDKILELIDQLDEPTPALLPFQWPVPENMQVVTRDGREVTQLVKFEGVANEYDMVAVVNGILLSYSNSGRIFRGILNEDAADLFLREKSPEMVEAWYCPSAITSITLIEDIGESWKSQGYEVYRVTFPKPTKSDI